MSRKIVIEVKKNPNETNTALLRRFSRQIQESGIIRKIKKIRYSKRAESKLTQKKAALKRIVKRKERERLIKMGKIGENIRY